MESGEAKQDTSSNVATAVAAVAAVTDVHKLKEMCESFNPEAMLVEQTSNTQNQQ